MITADDARNMARFLGEKKELWENVKNQIEAAAIRGEHQTVLAFDNPEDAKFVAKRIWAFGFNAYGGGATYEDDKPVKWYVDINWKNT